MEIDQTDFHIPTATTTTTRWVNLVKTRTRWDTHFEGKVNRYLEQVPGPALDNDM